MPYAIPQHNDIWLAYRRILRRQFDARAVLDDDTLLIHRQAQPIHVAAAVGAATGTKAATLASLS